MAVRKKKKAIENPFKERRNLLLQYIVLAGLVVGFIYLVVSSTGTTTTTTDNTAKDARHRLPNQILNFHRDAEKVHKMKNRQNHHFLKKRHEQQPDDNDADEEEDEEEFPVMTLDKYPTWLHKYYTKKIKWWAHGKYKNKLTRSILLQSVALGCDNLVQNQLSEGNFNYLYDFVAKKMDRDDSQVRQAGALWGLSLCYQYHPNKESYKAAMEKGFQFFLDSAVPGPAAEGVDSIVIHYPGSASSDTGANALVGLALIEYLRTVRDNSIDIDKAYETKLETKLKGVIESLKALRMDSTSNYKNHFSSGYLFDRKTSINDYSSYYDGETMLCLIKAAKYIPGYKDLVPIIEELAPGMVKSYTVDQWKDEHDSDETKGFYQWSSMFCHEYYTAEWKDYEMFGDYVIVLAHWMIHTHEVLRRQKNTGYAFEGIISAYEIAKTRKESAILEDLAYTIDKGLNKLTRWQVGGPLADDNDFLVEHETKESIAIGGIMNAVDEPGLRIDTTQHQMHAIIMALTSVYTA